MKVTYQQLITFRNNAYTYQQKHAGRFSKFLFAITKMTSKTDKNIEDYNERIQEINQELCEKDKDGFFKMDNPGTPSQTFKIPADKFALREAKVKELNKTEIEIEPHVPHDIIENLPADIDFNWWIYLSPFVLPEITEHIEEKLYEKQAERDAQQTVVK